MENINSLVLSGGGMQGYIHIGIIQYLEEINVLDKIKNIGGTSIGAFIGLMLILNLTYNNIINICKLYKNNIYNSFNIENFFENFGIDTFTELEKILSNILHSKNMDSNITFIELFNTTKKRFIINATCLNSNENVYIDHISFPNMPVIVGIKASMALPFMFSVVKYGNMHLIDGGLVKNFIIDHDIFNDENNKVLGIDIHFYNKHSIRNIDNIYQYVIKLVECVHHNCILNSVNKQHKNNNKIIMNIQSEMEYSMDFEMSENTQYKLISVGYNYIKNYVKN